MQAGINNHMAEKKFVNLHESYMRRYERGGFLVGDVFKFNDNFKSSDAYRQLGSNTQQLIDQMIDSGLHVRVVGIKDTMPARYPANDDTSSLAVNLDIALDTGGGRYSHHCTVPGNLGEPIQYAPNLLPIPDAMKRKSNVNIKPEEVEDYDNVSNKTDKGDGQLSDTELALADDNTQIPSDAVTPSPEVTSYTHQYLGDLATGPSAN